MYPPAGDPGSIPGRGDFFTGKFLSVLSIEAS